LDETLARMGKRKKHFSVTAIVQHLVEFEDDFPLLSGCEIERVLSHGGDSLKRGLAPDYHRQMMLNPTLKEGKAQEPHPYCKKLMAKLD
jgi:hypothetical protein